MIKHGKFFGHPYIEIRLKYKGWKSFSTFMDGYAIHTICKGDKIQKIRDFTIKKEEFNEEYVKRIIYSYVLQNK